MQRGKPSGENASGLFQPSTSIATSAPWRASVPKCCNQRLVNVLTCTVNMGRDADWSEESTRKLVYVVVTFFMWGWAFWAEELSWGAWSCHSGSLRHSIFTCALPGRCMLEVPMDNDHRNGSNAVGKTNNDQANPKAYLSLLAQPSDHDWPILIWRARGLLDKLPAQS